ncbi:MAG TPA: hypothetical protein VGG40_12475 [Solirubrobacterales bacterium]|jgi:hypothetical protein
MSPERRHVPEPGELIYVPKPSWAPAFFAIGGVGLVAGIYAAGFIFSPYIYALAGLIIFAGAFRSLTRGGIRGYFGLQRRQRVHSAALPIEQITLDD